MKNIPVLLTIAVVVLSVTILVFALGKGVSRKNSAQTQAPTQPPSSTSTTSSQPNDVATARGTVTAVSNESLTINTGSGLQTFSMAKLRDVQKVVSGTLEANNGRIDQASTSALKVGQELVVIASKDTPPKVRSILIVK